MIKLFTTSEEDSIIIGKEFLPTQVDQEIEHFLGRSVLKNIGQAETIKAKLGRAFSEEKAIFEGAHNAQDEGWTGNRQPD